MRGPHRRIGRRTGLLALGLLAVAIRLLVVFVVYPLTPGAHPEAVRAPDGYTDIAENLVRGEGYVRRAELGPELQRPPAYPMLNVLVFLVAGIDDRAVQLAQCLMGGLAAVLVAKLGARLLSPKAGWWAGSAGLLLGIATLTNAMWILLGVLWSGAAGRLRGERPGRVLALTALLVVAQAAVVAPWTIRNHRVTGELVPVSTSGGLTLWQGTFLSRFPSDSPHDHAAQVRLCLDAGTGIIGRRPLNPTPAEDDRFRALAMERIREDPVRWLRHVARNGIRIWYYNADRDRIPLILAMQLPFLLAAAVGAVAAWRRRPRAVLFLLVPIVYNVVLHMPFVAIARYSTVSTPFLAMLIGGVALLVPPRGPRRSS